MTGVQTCALPIYADAAARQEIFTKNKNAAFYEGQVKSAEFFIQTMLPVTLGRMAAIEAGSRAIVDIPETAFGGF